MLLGIGCALLLAAAYSFLSWQKHRENPNNTTVPNLRQLAAGVGRIFTPNRKGEVEFWGDLAASASRFALGMAAGVGLSFVTGIAMGAFTPVGVAVGPSLLFFGSIPPTAMLTVYYGVFGLDEALYVGLIALGVFPLLAGGLYNSVLTDVSDHAISKAYTLGASHAEVVWNVIVPQTLPRFLENVRLAAGLGLIFLVAGEWALGDVGFGASLREWSRFGKMDQSFPYVALLGVFGLLVDRAVLQLRRFVAPWWEG